MQNLASSKIAIPSRTDFHQGRSISIQKLTNRVKTTKGIDLVVKSRLGLIEEVIDC